MILIPNNAIFNKNIQYVTCINGLLLLSGAWFHVSYKIAMNMAH